ncbi:hypothetical protein BDZ89DRAFT_1047367 [Hymenopellis radicata]|nr:hypothetical protein BDZ89DRAFT_1047367 [Hymenopellis radicata]
MVNFERSSNDKTVKQIVDQAIQRPKRKCEDTKHERKERRRRAQAIAMDYETILAQSSWPVRCRKEIIEEKVSTLTSFPNTWSLNNFAHFEKHALPSHRRNSCTTLTRRMAS